MTVFIPAVSLSFSKLVEKSLTLLCTSSLETVLFLGWSLLAKCAIARTPIPTLVFSGAYRWQFKICDYY